MVGIILSFVAGMSVMLAIVCYYRGTAGKDRTGKQTAYRGDSVTGRASEAGREAVGRANAVLEEAGAAGKDVQDIINLVRRGNDRMFNSEE